jgi:AcrR family transcriptional regulator
MATSRSRPTSRHDRARDTRRRIAEAGHRLFVDRGYAQTTIADIARLAGVAPQTVYFVFGTKASVLAEVLDIQIVGDVEPIPLLERPAVTRIARIADPRRRLERLVALACDVTERLAPLYELARSGATDDEVRALLDRHEDQRWRALRALLELVEADLHDGLGATAAADHLYALLSHDVFWLLVQRRGWSPARWRRWAIADATTHLLSEAAIFQ